MPNYFYYKTGILTFHFQVEIQNIHILQLNLIASHFTTVSQTLQGIDAAHGASVDILE